MTKTYQDVLDETISFYSADPKNRRSARIGRDGKSVCFYIGPNGKKCAFAKWCKEDAVLEEGLPVAYLESCHAFFLKERLLPEIAHLTNIDFWSDLQSLHDNYLNWNEKGLSPRGLKDAAQIDKNIKNGEY